MDFKEFDSRTRDKFDASLLEPRPGGSKLAQDELHASDMVPYSAYYDDETIATKDDALVQVIKIDGLLFSALSQDQIKQFERQRNTALVTVANADMGLYVHLVRRKVDVEPEGSFNTWFGHYFNERWTERCRENKFFVNDIYITLIRSRFMRGPAGWIDRLVKFVSGTKDVEESFEKQAKSIYEATNFLLKALSPYGARRLKVQRAPEGLPEKVKRSFVIDEIRRFNLKPQEFIKRYGFQDFYNSSDLTDFLSEDYSEIETFFHYLVNLEDLRCVLTGDKINKNLVSARLNFKSFSDLLELRGINHHRVASVVSMQNWPGKTSSAMLDSLLKLEVEFICTQSFFFVDRISAESDMKLQMRRMETNQDIASDLIDEIGEGLKDLGANRVTTGEHHLAILLHTPVIKGGKEKTLDRLEDQVNLVKSAVANIGIKPVRETFGLESFFWAQLPGNQKYIGRRGTINSKNFAGFASLHNFAIGRAHDNLWGPAVIPLETESKTVYYFNFHREMEGMVAGHTAFTADTGAGKTTLLAALVAMADKANPRVFWFDNRHGAEIFMRAMGGRHTVLTAKDYTGWNPFRLPDSPENRIYLLELLNLMKICYSNADVTPDDIKRFNRAIVENYQLPEEDRRLRHVAWAFGKDDLSDIMSIWHSNGANSKLFDNEMDNFDLSNCRYYCYEMRQLLKDGEARPELAVVLSYPFHRIEQAMDGTPFIMVLEECQNLVKHKFWREKIDSYIMQIRRKNGILIFVTPDAKYLFCETDSIKKQTVTKIFLPNAQAVAKDYIYHLDLTPAEFEFVRDTPVDSRKFLIRRGQESIRAVFDLSDMTDVIPILSSNDRAVRMMHGLFDELGTQDPSIWVPALMRRAKENNTHNLGQ